MCQTEVHTNLHMCLLVAYSQVCDDVLTVWLRSFSDSFTVTQCCVLSQMWLKHKLKKGHAQNMLADTKWSAQHFYCCPLYRQYSKQLKTVKTSNRCLTSLTPAPCRRHCVLLVVMWSSAEVLEDESPPWLSGSLSLSSMEANTALSIQTDNRTQSRAYSH